MNIKKLLIVSILLLFLITAVSAAENTTQDDEIASENTQIELELNQTNIQVPEKIWKDGNNSISIETNEASEIEISGAITYNSTLTPGKTSIPINLTTGRHSIYINSPNTQKEYNITVLKENPHWDLDFNYMDESEILYGPPYDYEIIDSALTILNMPEGLTGNFSFYVNGEFMWTHNALDLRQEEIYYGGYFEEQAYNLTVKYSGDDYFYPASKSKIIEFTPVLISIPKEVIPGYDDTIYVGFDYGYERGSVSIRINNKTVYKKDKIDSDLRYPVQYSLKDLKVNEEYEIEVNFTSDYCNKTKKVKVNVTDHIKDYVTFVGKDTTNQDNFKYIYGIEYEFYIMAPKLNLNIAIDNKKVDYEYDDGIYLIDMDSQSIGKHEINVSYAGDKKYGKNTFKHEFEVVARAECEIEVEQNQMNRFTLLLPEDAVGNLTVDLKKSDDKEFEFYTRVEVEGSVQALTFQQSISEHIFLGHTSMGTVK